MAYSCKHLCFLFLLVIYSSIQIQARESKFFSKVTHYSITKNNGKKGSTASAPIQAPTPAPAPSPSLLGEVPIAAPVFSTESEYGYGHFGPGSGMFLPKKEASTTTTIAATTSDENELLNEELDGVTYNEKYESSNYNNNNGYKLGSARYETGNQNNNGYTNNYNNNNGYNGNYNYNGYKLAGESYETSNQNYENGYNNYNNNGYRSNNYNNNNGYTTNHNNNNNGYTTNYNNNNGYTTNYNNNGYNTERQGMSDTRYMKGGKYYYNVKNENYYPINGDFESGKVSTQNQGYYGNNESPNEFNTTEEYESQEAYEENQEEPLP